jgi:hypothetical protein
VTRPREGLRSGATGRGTGIDVPPNQWMNRAIREGAMYPPETSIDLEPETMAGPLPEPTHRIREAARQLSHRIRR